MVVDDLSSYAMDGEQVWRFSRRGSGPQGLKITLYKFSLTPSLTPFTFDNANNIRQGKIQSTSITANHGKEKKKSCARG